MEEQNRDLNYPLMLRNVVARADTGQTCAVPLQ